MEELKWKSPLSNEWSGLSVFLKIFQLVMATATVRGATAATVGTTTASTTTTV
jgi:hypothetical protein